MTRPILFFGGEKWKNVVKYKKLSKGTSQKQKVFFHTHYIAHYSHYIAKCSYEKKKMARNELCGFETSADL